MIATLAALATAFVALQLHKPVAQAQASVPAAKVVAVSADAAPVLPAIRFFSSQGEAGTHTLTDY